MQLSQEQLSKIAAELIDWVQQKMLAIGGKNAVIGISGGKDSSVVAALACEALGADHVIGVLMPRGNQADLGTAKALCESLAIDHRIIDIEPMCAAFENAIRPGLENWSQQSTFNLPPRVRMTVLYAIAQSTDGVVWNTSNLSEDWVGYATVYGDTAGAFSPLAMFTTDEVVQLGAYLGVDESFLFIPPADGLTGKTDEEVLGFTYQSLNEYIRTGHCANDELQKQIDSLHRKSRFKFQTIPMFDNGLPILADDVAGIYKK